MTIKRLDTAELCFYKLLLLKSDVFENESIGFSYLEKEMKINHQILLKPFKNLLENNIISLSDEALTDGYIEAYRAKRADFEARERNLSVASAVSGGNYYDYESTKLWKTFFTDKYCELTKEFYDKLVKEKNIKVKIEKEVLNTGDCTIQLIYFFQFNLKIDKEKLAKYLDNYLSGFIQDEYNDGKKYTYPKQVQEISAAIKKLINAGYSAKSLLLDNAQIFPKNKVDIHPTDGQRQEAIWLYDFLDTVLAMEKEGLLKVLDIQYQEKIDRVIAYSGLIWDDPIKIKICVNKKFYQAEIDEIKNTEMRIEAIEKMVRQKTEEDNRWVEEVANPPQNTKFDYNPNTGDGQLRGKEFRLKDGTDYRKLFDACYAIKGEKLEKQKVIEILGLKDNNVGIEKIFSALGDSKTRRKPNTEVLITRAITDIAKKIRDKTGLNTQELVNNGGNIILNI